MTNNQKKSPVATSPRTGQDNCNSQTVCCFTLTQNNYNDNNLRLVKRLNTLINGFKYYSLKRYLNCVASGDTLTGGAV